MNLADLTIGELAAAVSAFLVVAAVVWRFLHRAYRGWVATRDKVRPLWAGVEKALVVLNGREESTTPDGMEIPGVKPVLERLTAIEALQTKCILSIANVQADLLKVKHEVQHNGGGSIKDAVKRIEESLTKGDARFGEIEERIDARFAYADGVIADGFARLERLERGA